jgi:hypothetical protein
LYRVIYDEDEQDRLVTAIFDRVDKFAAQFREVGQGSFLAAVSLASEEKLVTKFRAVGTRVVPYQTVSLRDVPLRTVYLGWSSAMFEEDQVLRLLLTQTGNSDAEIVRSRVELKP